MVICGLIGGAISVPERPLLLVPGYTGSILYARNTTDNSTFKVFPTLPQSFDYLYCECIDQIDVNNNRCDSIYDDIEIYAPMDNYGLFAIDILNEEADKEYYHKLIELLVNEEGYEEGVTLFGFPYDWRQSFTEISSQLITRVNEIIEQTNYPKIDILSHSMGCVLTKKYLSDSSQGHNGDHPKIEKYVSVAGPYGGIGASWTVISLWGTTSTDIAALPWTMHQLSLQFPSTYDFFAISTHYAAYAASIKTEENDIVVPSFAYLVNGEQVTFVADDSLIEIIAAANEGNSMTLPNSDTPCSIPFRTDYYNKAKASWEIVDAQTLEPNQYFEVYGINSITPVSWMIPVNITLDGENTDYTPLLSNGKLLFGANYFPQSIGCAEGDQLITIESVKNSKFTPIYSAYLPLDHVGLINNEESFPIYQQFLNAACSWEGFWEMELLAINTSNFYPPNAQVIHCPDLDFEENEVLCDGEVCGTYDGDSVVAHLKVYDFNWIAYTAQDELSNSDSTIQKIEGRFWGNQWTGRMILTNGEILQFSFQMSTIEQCQTFVGWYSSDWYPDLKKPVQGTRISAPDSSQCATGSTRACSIPNATGNEVCEDGFWSSCTSCKTGYIYDSGFPYSYPSCVALLSSPSPSPTKNPSPSPSPSSLVEPESSSGSSLFSFLAPSALDDDDYSNDTVIIIESTEEVTADGCYEVPWYVFVIFVIVAFIMGIIVSAAIIGLAILLKPRLMSLRKPAAPAPTPNVEMNEINDNIF